MMGQITCCNCHVQFTISDAHERQLRNCENTFYCPNGHAQSYRGDTEIEALKKTLQDKDRELANKACEIMELNRKLKHREYNRKKQQESRAKKSTKKPIKTFLRRNENE